MSISGRRRPTNVTVSAEVLAEARAWNINLSATLERAPTNEIREHKRRRWLAENAGAIAAYNARVVAEGVFSDGLRSF